MTSAQRGWSGRSLVPNKESAAFAYDSLEELEMIVLGNKTVHLPLAGKSMSKVTRMAFQSTTTTQVLPVDGQLFPLGLLVFILRLSPPTGLKAAGSEKEEPLKRKKKPS